MPYRNFLLIDDDKDDQEIFMAALDRISPDFKCTPFSAAKEALLQLQAVKIRPEVIFLDLNMPIMTGQQFLEEIKKMDGLKEIPVIILSTSSNTATIAATKELGAEHFITKPHRFDDLVDILKPIIQ